MFFILKYLVYQSSEELNETIDTLQLFLLYIQFVLLNSKCQDIRVQYAHTTENANIESSEKSRPGAENLQKRL